MKKTTEVCGLTFVLVDTYGYAEDFGEEWRSGDLWLLFEGGRWSAMLYEILPDPNGKTWDSPEEAVQFCQKCARVTCEQLTKVIAKWDVK